MIRKSLFISSLFVLTMITGCSNPPSHATHVLNVGALAGPETRLLEVAKNVAKKTSGLSVNIIEYSEHTHLPLALSKRSVDVTFAEFPNESEASDHPFVSMGKFFLYPTSLYSRKVKNKKDLQVVDHLWARLDNKDDPRIQKLITALRSPEVSHVAEKLFNGQAVAGWESEDS